MNDSPAPTDPLRSATAHVSTFASAKPVPIPDELSAPFFDGAQRGQMMLLRCGACATFQSPLPFIGVPLRSRCVECFAGELTWVAASGNATLYSFAIIHQLYDEAFAADIPYNIAVVETDEGVRVTSQVVGCENHELAIGMELKVTFEHQSDIVPIPRFKPRT